jgi:transcriptional regulator with XRE-family HTH domain
MVKEKLLEARLKKGLSQEELADLVGMSQPNYSRRENGLKKISDAEWSKIAKELKVTREEIYEEDLTHITIYNSGTVHFNMPDFVLEHIELLKSQNLELKERIKFLENQISGQ